MAPAGFSLLTLASLIALSVGYQTFQSSIPNGNAVPDPCKPGSLWGGVGHWSPQGYNARNPFGLAFQANGNSWSKALCQADSDGDGRPNGLELGDPNCTWTSGTTPPLSSGLSHPGICEPPASSLCRKLNTVNVCALSSNGAPSISLSFLLFAMASLVSIIAFRRTAFRF
ncbi:temptin-like [Lineus longissimus]|uniref:temptin-like n=1 Tax=Lineus longissimus TaxID=88925 RepID=UPI002B4DE9CA